MTKHIWFKRILLNPFPVSTLGFLSRIELENAKANHTLNQKKKKKKTPPEKKTSKGNLCKNRHLVNPHILFPMNLVTCLLCRKMTPWQWSQPKAWTCSPASFLPALSGTASAARRLLLPECSSSSEPDAVASSHKALNKYPRTHSPASAPTPPRCLFHLA